MSNGRIRGHDREDGAAGADVVLRPASGKQMMQSDAADSSEIDTLRSMNAHLLRQVAQLRQREAQAQRLADRDGLTGLFNRRRMVELLDSSIAEAARQHHRVGLLFIDLDGFKDINDDYGHAMGDKLLITVASRLTSRTRTADVVCRFGGDEFVVILPRIADLAAVGRVADSIRGRLALPYRIDGAELRLTASIGGSVYPDEAGAAAKLMHLADARMYRCKAQAADPDISGASSMAPARRREDRLRRRSGA